MEDSSSVDDNDSVSDTYEPFRYAKLRIAHKTLIRVKNALSIPLKTSTILSVGI